MSSQSRCRPKRSKKERTNKSFSALEVARTVLDVFLRDSEISQTYASSQIKILQDRIEQWESKSWHVGIIGITSSGKSTILNALFQEELLPSGVRPSSNCLIKCHQGPELKCTIVFTNGKKSTLRGSARKLKLRLAQLGDERHNERNREGVEEIILSSPKFLLPKGITLIDSPGLDAFGHQDHEEVTLRQLVPTVDLVLYTTCTKASSDERLSFYMKLISEEGKPVLLLQNKIDSIVPKRGKFGRIIKTVSEIQAEHRLRLENSIKRGCDERVLKNVTIFQISALKALRGRLQDSAIPQLVSGFQNQIKALVPKFDATRLQQIHELISRTSNELEEQLSLNAAELRTSLDQRELSYTKTRQAISNNFNAMSNTLSSHRDSIKARFDAIKSRLRSLTANSQNEARAIVYEFKEIFDAVAPPLTKTIKSEQEKLKKVAKKLNLSPDDYIVQYQARRRGTGHISVSEKNKTETYQRRVKVNSFTGFFGNLFGTDWGYEYQTHTRTITQLNVKKFRQDVTQKVNQSLSWLETQEQKIKSLFADQTNILLDKVDLLLQGLADQRSAQVTQEKKQLFLEQLRALQSKIPQATKPVPELIVGDEENDPLPEVKSAKLTLTAPRQVVKRLHSVNKLASLMRASAQQTVLSTLYSTVYQGRDVVIWGWDVEAIIVAYEQFFGHLDEPTSDFVKSSLEQHRSYTFTAKERALTLCRVDGELTDRDSTFNETVLRQASCHILICNPGQIGSYLSSFARAKLNPLFSKETLLLTESVDECETGDQLGEQLRELRDWTAHFTHCLGWCALTPNMRLQILLETLRREPSQIQTQIALQTFVARLRQAPASLGAELDPQYISECVRVFLS